MKFYLSGGMEYKKNFGMGWREWLTKELEVRRHEAVDPVQLESPDEHGNPIQDQLTQWKLSGELEKVRQVVRTNLFHKDMYGIQLAECLVLLYDESVQRGAGSLSEAWEAWREARPIYLVTDFSLEKIPTWLIGETTAIFKDFDEFLEYVDNHSNIIRDMMQAKQVRDEVLGGIY